MASTLISLRSHAIALILGLMVVSVYSPAIHHRFVTYDDGAHIYRNPRIDPPTVSSVLSFWKAPYQGLYVPVTYTAWAAIEFLGRHQHPAKIFSPTGYHIANLLVHAANVGMVFLILSYLGMGTWAAGLATLLFAFHPLQVESVVWISSLKDLLCGFFSLLAIGTIVALPNTRQSYLIAFGFYALAFLSKPSAICLPFFLIGFTHWMKEVRWATAMRRYLPWAIAAVPFIWLTKRQQPNEAMEYVTPLLSRPFVALDTVAFYFQKLIFPFGLSLNYGRTPNRILEERWYFLALAALIPGVYLAWRYRRSKVLQVFLGLFLVALLPTLGLIPFYYQKYSTAADRFAYFALFGAAIGLALGIQQSKRFCFSVMATSCLIGGLVFLTRQQIPIWNTDATLVTRIVSVNPSAENHYNLATMLIAELSGSNPVPGTAPRPLYQVRSLEERKDWEKLIEYHFRAAIEKDPEYSFAYNNLGIFYQNLGELKQAENAFRLATEHSPKLAEAYNNLGVAQAAQSLSHQALTNFKKALELEPKFADAKFNLSMAEDELGDAKSALKHLREAVALDPNKPEPRLRLAMKLEGQHQKP